MMHGRRALAAAVATAIPAAVGADEPRTLAVRPTDLSLRWQPEPEPTPPPPARFGDAGSRWWTVGAGFANDLHESTDINLHGAYGYFLIEHVEFSLELAAWHFEQRGDDALGINPAMLFRWHFVNEDPWSVFVDAGIGLLFTNDNVPEGGTSADFTPRVGIGATRRITPGGARLQAGLRWHHLSNARILGDLTNPSRDGLLLYAGVQWPF